MITFELEMRIGGPGSGKITHCDRLAIIDERLFHLNMMLALLEVAAEMGKNIHAW